MPRIAFEAAAVTVATPDGDRVVLAPTTLELTEQRIGIIGANGSGKSTLARLVNGLVAPTEGRVLVDGVDVRDRAPEELWAGIGLVPQKAFLFGGSMIAVVRPGRAVRLTSRSTLASAPG